MTNHSKSLTIAWEIAAREAIESSTVEISPSHLLIGLCKLCNKQILEIEEEIQGLLSRLGDVDPKQLRRRLRSLLPPSASTPHSQKEIHRSQKSKQAFQRAEEIAQAKNSEYIFPEHLLQAILEPIHSPLADQLSQLGFPNLYEQLFKDEIDNDDRLRHEAMRAVWEEIGRSAGEFQDLFESHQTSNPSEALELLQSTGAANPRLREKLRKVADKVLAELVHSPKVRKIITETSLDALITVFAPLGIAVKAIKILLEQSEIDEKQDSLKKRKN